MRPVFICFFEVISLGFDVVRDDGLVGRLGTAIGIGRANWAVFRNRDHVRKACCVTIDCGRGGKNDVGDIVLGHAAEEADRSVDICAVVFQRDFG